MNETIVFLLDLLDVVKRSFFSESGSVGYQIQVKDV